MCCLNEVLCALAVPWLREEFWLVKQSVHRRGEKSWAAIRLKTVLPAATCAELESFSWPRTESTEEEIKSLWLDGSHLFQPQGLTYIYWWWALKTSWISLSFQSWLCIFWACSHLVSTLHPGWSDRKQTALSPSLTCVSTCLEWPLVIGSLGQHNVVVFLQRNK